MVHGGEDTVEHMVAAVELPGALNGNHITGIGHHADGAFVTLGTGANAAQTAGGEIAAHGTQRHAAFGIHDGVGKLLGLPQRQAQHVKGQTLGALTADAGQTGKLFHQFFQRCREVFHTGVLRR